MSYPRLTAPGLTIGEFAPPRSVEYLQDGAAAVRHEFSTLVTPRTAGVHRLGPVSVSGEVSAPSNDAGSFFGETTAKKINFEAAPSELTVLPLPAIAKPVDFTGVIGHFTMSVSAEPTAVESGAPLTVTTRISGTGSLRQAVCPDVSPVGFKIYPAHVQHSANSMLCTQVIIPQTAATPSVPPLHFSFFNSSSARYESLQSAAIPLTVTQQDSAKTVVPNQLTVPVRPASTSRSALIAWWCGGLFIAATGICLFLIRRRNITKKIETVTCHQRSDTLIYSFEAYVTAAEQALSCNDVEWFYLAVFRALENVHGVPNASQPLDVAMLSAECDAVRYGRHDPDYREMELLLARLKSLMA